MVMDHIIMRDNLLQIEWIETMAAHMIAKKYLSI